MRRTLATLTVLGAVLCLGVLGGCSKGTTDSGGSGDSTSESSDSG